MQPKGTPRSIVTSCFILGISEALVFSGFCICLFSILSLPPPEPHLLSIGGLGAFSLEPGNSGHRLGHELPHFSQERISQLDEAPSDAQ